jgi:16S rRNA (guanine1516-N2)-methyltransferase
MTPTNMLQPQQTSNSIELLLPANASNEVQGKMNAVAERTGLPVVDQPQADFYLYIHKGQLTLRNQTQARPVDVSVDFCTGKNRHRLQFGGGLGQPLARAVNAKTLRQSSDDQTVICDATGGFGRDSLVFATLGCRVVILEQSAIVFELLKDGISRAQQDDALRDTANRLEVHRSDSTLLPQGWPYPFAPHTIYLDPMYPLKTKQAAAKKEMQTLKQLFADNNNEDNDQKLLAAALATASARVVVKRPATALPIAGATPVGNISSPNTRYDLYRPTATG